MIARFGWRLAAWSCAASGVAALAWAVLTPVASVEQAGSSRAPATSRPQGGRAYRADSAAAVVIGRDPFRRSRRPAGVAYDPQRADAPPPSLVPKPVLVLVGLVTGPEPTALIEGFPGIDGALVVRVGDVVAGVRVAAIRAHEVRLAGLDTAWTLTVRKPWR